MQRPVLLMHAPASCGRGDPRPIYRPFVLSALVATLTLGTTFGAANLFVMHQGSGAAWINSSAHATSQLFGFLFLFILGVAFFAVPRFLGVNLAKPKLARAALPLVWLGLALRCAALFTAPGPLGLAMLGAGGAALLAAVVVAAVSLLATRRASAAPYEPFQLGIAAGTVLFGIAAALQFAGVVDAFASDNAHRAALWSRPSYVAALFGGGYLWVLGMHLRIGPVFVGARKSGARNALLMLALAAAAALLLVAGSIIEGPLGYPSFTWPRAAGTCLFASSTIAALACLRVFSRPASEGRSLDGTFRRIVQGTFAALLLSAALLVLDVLPGLGNHLIADAGRHTFAVGFLLTITFAFATRILPIFAGVAPVWPESRGMLFGLVGAGVLLRTAQVIAAMGGYRALWLSAVSGLVVLVGVAGLSLIVAKTVWRPANAARQARLSAVTADTNVLQMIDTWPATLEVMVRHGFEPLRSAAVRNVLARSITVQLACEIRGVEVSVLVAELNAIASADSAAPRRQ